MCREATRVVLHLGSKSEALSPLGLKGQRREVMGAERGSSIERGPPATSVLLKRVPARGDQAPEEPRKGGKAQLCLPSCPHLPSQLLFLLSGSNEAARSPADSVQKGVPAGPGDRKQKRTKRTWRGRKYSVQRFITHHCQRVDNRLTVF